MFSNSEFGRNIEKMLGGVGFAQVLNFLASLVLARLYDETDFGRLAIFTSTMMLLTNLAGLRYELATVLPKRQEEAFSVLGLALGWNLFFGLASWLLLLLFGAELLEWLGVEELNSVFLWIPLAIFLLSAFNSFNYWYTRQKEFGYIARVQIGQTLAGALAQIGFAFLLPTLGLILGFMVRLATGFLLFSQRFLPQLPLFRRSIQLPHLKTVARKYREFPLVNGPHVGIDILQNEGIVFLVVYFFTASVVGSYAFALRVIKAPLGIIGRALTPVFYQKATELFQQDRAELLVLVKKIYGRLFLLGLPGFALLFFFAPDLFALLFGENWREAGQIARILTPWLFLNFIASPLSQLPLIFNRQRGAFLLACLGLILKLGGLLLAGWTGVDGAGAFLYLCIGATIYQTIVLGWYYWMVSKTDGK